MGFKWVVTPTSVFPGSYEEYKQSVFAGIEAVAERNAKAATAWMKANHPWQNRTGNAEAGLTVDVESTPLEKVDMIFSYGPNVPYDIYLEFSWAGRLQILAPAVDLWSVQVMNDLKDVARISVTKPAAI